MNHRLPILLLPVVAFVGCGRQSETEISVRKIIAAQLKGTPEAIQMNVPLRDQKADDLHLVEILMTLEERFEVKIPDQIIEKYAGGKVGHTWSKLTPSQLVQIVEECKALPFKRKK